MPPKQEQRQLVSWLCNHPNLTGCDFEIKMPIDPETSVDMKWAAFVIHVNHVYYPRDKIYRPRATRHATKYDKVLDDDRLVVVWLIFANTSVHGLGISYPDKSKDETGFGIGRALSSYGRSPLHIYTKDFHYCHFPYSADANRVLENVFNVVQTDNVENGYRHVPFFGIKQVTTFSMNQMLYFVQQIPVHPHLVEPPPDVIPSCLYAQGVFRLEELGELEGAARGTSPDDTKGKPRTDRTRRCKLHRPDTPA